MKIAYLGKIQLSDVDLSYIHEAQRIADVTYIMEVNPRFMRGPAFNFKSLYPKSGLFKAAEIYPEYNKMKDFIDLDKCYVLNTTGKFWMIKSFWTHLILLLFLVRQHFDIIHLAWPPNIYEFIVYILRGKMMLTVHDPFPHTAHNTLSSRFRRRVAFFLVPRLIILNKAQRKEFLDYYKLPEQRVIDSRLSCYTYLRTITPLPSADKGKQYILFAGRISPYKGLDYLLPAMEEVHKQCPNCTLVIAGKGDYHFDISYYKSLDYIDIRNRFIPDDELVTLIKDCAFMVCPYTDATQSGVIMSAFAFNKPVIATNVGGLPEMVKHQHYGLIIKRNDIQILADSIVSLLKQPETLESYSMEIKKDYSTGVLSWRHIAAELNNEYKKILD